MDGSTVDIITATIIWAGYIFLSALLLCLARNIVESQSSWGDLFAERPGESHHLARYVLFFGTIILAAKFLFAVVNAESFYLTDEVQQAMQLSEGFDVEALVGGYGAAYLMAKVTDGQILSLFGRRQF
jgi:hypothetical protein